MTVDIDKLSRFASTVDKELAYRKRELISHEQLISIADDHQKTVLFRTGVLLLYAHWEGFVKSAIKLYLQLYEGHAIGDLPLHAKSALIFQRLKSDQLDKLSYKLPKAVFGYLSDSSYCVLHTISNIVDTMSNLDSQRFEYLLHLIENDISNLNEYDFFILNANFIDSELLATRHKIAHGERLPVTEDDFKKMSTKTVELIDKFKESLFDVAHAHYSQLPLGQ